jgi:ssDNA-binding Zn-finger/Zn-ribbon topoisomerase 1
VETNEIQNIFEDIDKKLATHEFVLINNFGYLGVLYKCKKCGYEIQMRSGRLGSSGIYLKDLYGVLSCDEYIIKDIIE